MAPAVVTHVQIPLERGLKNTLVFLLRLFLFFLFFYVFLLSAAFSRRSSFSVVFFFLLYFFVACLVFLPPCRIFGRTFSVQLLTLQTDPSFFDTKKGNAFFEKGNAPVYTKWPTLNDHAREVPRTIQLSFWRFQMSCRGLRFEVIILVLREKPSSRKARIFICENHDLTVN